MSAEARLVVRQVRSENGRPWQQRLVLKGLGLRGINSQVELLNQRAIRGMIRKVLHLVEVQESQSTEPKAPAKPARAAKGSKS
ncbi:MAG: Ribosomal protein L30p/L7e [Pseudomonadota bacterium]|jgi:large subunit ribosomal protein L30